MKHTISISIISCVALSCAGPKLTNSDRGNYRAEKLKSAASIVEVIVSSEPLPPPPAKVIEKPKYFYDLKDSLPHTYLNTIIRASDYDKFIKAVASPVMSPPAAKPEAEAPRKSPVQDPDLVRVRLKFQNTQYFFRNHALLHPNTKLEFLNTTVELQGNFAVISSIDKVQNEYEDIDMGTMERTNEVKFNTSLSGTVGGGNDSENTTTNDNGTSDSSGSDSSDEITKESDGKKAIGKSSIKSNSESSSNTQNVAKRARAIKAEAKAEAQYANTESIKEALSLKFKKLSTGFSNSPTKLTISQRGKPFIGVFDIVFVTLTLKINDSKISTDTKTVTKFGNLFDKDGNTQKIDNITRTTESRTFVPCALAEDIKLVTTYSGAIRATRNLRRGRNVGEFDDKVKYYTFDSIPGEGSINIGKSQFCQTAYNVIARKDGFDYILNATLPSGTVQEVLLFSDDSPAEFMKWLRTVAKEGDKAKLKSAKGDLFFIEAKGREVNGVVQPQRKIKLSEQVLSDADVDALRNFAFGLNVKVP